MKIKNEAISSTLNDKGVLMLLSAVSGRIEEQPGLRRCQVVALTKGRTRVLLVSRVTGFDSLLSFCRLNGLQG